ncbi:MAG: hypothetical protein K8R23_18255 [Chthoniobacter sp.]|nr:hypothetical protein [Chthoniobacter sp.]
MFFTGCSKTKPAGDATAEFWTWFTAQSAEYARLLSYETHASAPNDSERQKQVEQAVADTASRLRRINPEFSPFFGYSGGANKLMITVGGQKQLFAAVDQFVSTAPKIAGWTFVALKPPLNFDAATEIKSGSVALKLGDMRYSRQRQGDGSFAFTVFVPSNVSSDPDGFRRLCTRLLEDSLGERVAATAIHSLEVRQLDATSQPDLLEFIHVHRDITSTGF